MRLALLILLSLVTCGLAWYFRCQHVNATRHPLGGFVCPDCGYTSVTLPTLDGGHVDPQRRNRDPLALVRGEGL